MKPFDKVILSQKKIYPIKLHAPQAKDWDILLKFIKLY